MIRGSYQEAGLSEASFELRLCVSSAAQKGDGPNATRWWSGDPSGVAQTALSSAAARAPDARAGPPAAPQGGTLLWSVGTG